jgi:homoserine dehydrogenase
VNGERGAEGVSRMNNDEKPIGVAVLGLGNVGSEVVRIIEESASDLTARIGAPLVLRGIGVRRVADDRGVPTDLLTDNVEELVSRDDVDVVVELMGPVEPARKAILSALEQGKSVVTANKALMAVSTGELAQAAEHAHVDLYFEAAVAGAIPVIRPLTQSLAGDTVLRVAGIVNGTTNYILSEMDSTGADYDSALADASALGYAEADPTADVEGYDAAAKAAILASIAFHTRVTADDVYREGITKVTAADFASARALGCTIKLLAICERLTTDEGQQRVSARVYPALVPLDHPLAAVNGAFNAVVVEAEAAGRLMFYGQGAGGAPTASAVMGDVVMAARNRVQGGRGPRESKYAKLPISPIGFIPTRYYVNMNVADRPGVLSAVAAEFGKREVSIAEVRQEGMVDEGGQRCGARIVVVTHQATDAALSETVAALADLDMVQSVNSVLRMEGSSD